MTKKISIFFASIIIFVFCLTQALPIYAFQIPQDGDKSIWGISPNEFSEYFESKGYENLGLEANEFSINCSGFLFPNIATDADVTCYLFGQFKHMTDGSQQLYTILITLKYDHVIPHADLIKIAKNTGNEVFDESIKNSYSDCTIWRLGNDIDITFYIREFATHSVIIYQFYPKEE